MKTIGLIGGMSWQSSKMYYELINTRVNLMLGNAHSCKSIIVTVDFAEIEKLTFENKWNEIGDIVASSAKQLEKGGADIILLCTNTIHLVSHFITKITDITFLHIADATGRAIQKKQLKKVALLGTKFTMEKNFYTKILEDKYHIEVMIPDVEERQILQDIIYKELVKGKFTEDSKQECIEIINTLKKDGAEGVILGCTELPLLIPDNSVDILTFDTARIHAFEAVSWALDIK